MADKPMMKCGDVAQGHDGTGAPVCAIHVGTSRDADARTPAPEPDLTGRTAVCSYRHGATMTPVPSSTSLAFFEHRPDEQHDLFYDGCFGWD